MGQKKRAKKVSQGTGRGAKPTTLTPVQRVLMGKGLYRTFAPIASVKHD